MNCVVERCKKEKEYSKRYKNVTEKEKKKCKCDIFLYLILLQFLLSENLNEAV